MGRLPFTAGHPHFARWDIGAYTYGLPMVRDFSGAAQLCIGKFCSLSDSAVLLLAAEHDPNMVTTYPLHDFFAEAELRQIAGSKGDIIIGSDVWIAHGAIILSGVSIGDGAVVGAGAVVTRNVPAYAVVAGNPARLLRYRFPQDVREALLRVRWWDWPEPVLRERWRELYTSDVADFAAKYDPAPPRGWRAVLWNMQRAVRKKHPQARARWVLQEGPPNAAT